MLIQNVVVGTFDGEVYVVADDAGRPNTLILFPHEHKPQEWLLQHKEEAEDLLLAIANAVWGRPRPRNFDWVARTYPQHGHVQLSK